MKKYEYDTSIYIYIGIVCLIILLKLLSSHKWVRTHQLQLWSPVQRMKQIFPKHHHFTSNVSTELCSKTQITNRTIRDRILGPSIVKPVRKKRRELLYNYFMMKKENGNLDSEINITFFYTCLCSKSDTFSDFASNTRIKQYLPSSVTWEIMTQLCSKKTAKNGK